MRGPSCGLSLAACVGSRARWSLEYLPNVACHKGDAVEWIARDVQAATGREPRVVFLGTISPMRMPRAVGRGIGVLVGSRPTTATHQLDGIADVDTLLRWLTARK